ncbi:hypothetical protein GE09DRAFT_1085490 [Coniochaeta sp. 2T2.1]|nr:hypothetical protein GE09DRAFT_1085490 [Coniochaeta sp. 2T2.1]
MCYFFPAAWTKDGQGTPTNYVLSVTDQSFIGKMYPFRTRNEGQYRIEGGPKTLNSRLIHFSTPYLEAPNMVLGLNELDEGCGANIRIKVQTDGIEKRDGNDFKLNLDTWSDSKLYGAGATWLEFAGNESEFQVGEFDTLTDRPIIELATPDKSGVRADVKKFTFPAGTFASEPNVVVWLKALDISKEANWRVRAVGREVKAEGFELAIESWADTRLYSATASWVAYPKGQTGVYSGIVNTLDSRGWWPPVAENCGKVTFPTSYDRDPRVFAAISYLDMDSARNLRIKGFVDRVSQDGFVWHADTWSDSVLYSAGLNWISFG